MSEATESGGKIVEQSMGGGGLERSGEAGRGDAQSNTQIVRPRRALAGELTPPELACERLGIAQGMALEVLVEGRSITEAARVAGVSRASVHHWLKNVPDFQAALNEWLEELDQGARARLRRMNDKALEAVERSLERGEPVIAMQVLKGNGIVRTPKPRVTDVQEIRDRLELSQLKRKVEFQRERQKLCDEG